MQYEIGRLQLIKHLRRVSEGVDVAKRDLIYQNLLMQVEGNKLTLSSTNSELTIHCHTEGLKNSKDGSIAVDARKLLQICTSVTGQDLSLKVTGSEGKQKLTVQTSTGKYSLSLSDTNMFSIPPAQDEQPICQLELPVTALHDLLSKVEHFAAPKTEWRPYLIGVLLEVSDRQLTAVATDSHRLALAQCSTEAEASPLSVIVPKMCIAPIMTLLASSNNPSAKKPETVKVEIWNRAIRLVTSEYEVTSSLVNGRYPDYQQVLPSEDEKSFQRVQLSVEDLRNVLRRMQIITGTNGGVTLALQDKEIMLSATNSEGDESEDKLEADCTASDQAVSFNVRYLLSALDKLEVEQVEFRFFGKGASAEFRLMESGSLRYILMPLST